jgi:hypothetical protein
MSDFNDKPFETSYIVADESLTSIFGRYNKDQLEDAKICRSVWREAYPNLHIVIFERTSLTTWEGRFIAKEATVVIGTSTSKSTHSA